MSVFFFFFFFLVEAREVTGKERIESLEWQNLVVFEV